jgi:CheY-like chemotaxis protein
MTSVSETGGCILIVEDDSDFREALAELLQIEPPCLILLDLMMPVMSGWEFRKRQRQDPSLAKIPVAVVTGVRNMVDRLSDLDAVVCFQKPVDLDELLAAVAQYC